MHHIKHWMKKSIAEVEEPIEKKVDQQTDRMIQEVHQRLDAYDLRVLARPTATIDLTTLLADLASLMAYVDAILDLRVPEPKAAP